MEKAERIFSKIFTIINTIILICLILVLFVVVIVIAKSYIFTEKVPRFYGMETIYNYISGQWNQK